jgi:hypothetical protein
MTQKLNPSRESHSELIDSNFKFYKQVMDKPEFATDFLGLLFESCCRSKGQGAEDRAQ